jgi:2,5-diketo-D-gluconate reductase A
MSETQQAPAIDLRGPVPIPQLGFGVFEVVPEETEAAVRSALEVGYRHIDTAAIYRNEAEVGRAIAGSDGPRDELFVTTKLWNADQGRDAALQAFEASSALLGLDVVDLYLIHWPCPGVDRYVDSWKALVELQDSGRVRAIGVSNFKPAHLERIIDATGVVPTINQVELHPRLAQEELRAFHARHGIVTEAWSPLARGAVLDDPAVVAIAEAHDRTPAQVVLRWHVELGNVVIPRSVRPERIRSNFELFDFALTDDERATISGLDRGERIGPDPDAFDYVG